MEPVLGFMGSCCGVEGGWDWGGGLVEFGGGFGDVCRYAPSREPNWTFEIRLGVTKWQEQ